MTQTGHAYQAASATDQAVGSGSAVDDDWLFRFELFQGLLEQSGLNPVSSIPDVFVNPEKTVVVLTGQISSSFPPRLIERFCARGGHLLVACDTGFSAGRIAEFQKGPVIVRGSQNRYLNFEDCIVISDFPAEHPITNGVQRLVFNRTGWLKKPRWFLPAWQQLANLPANVSPRNSRSQPVILQVETTDSMQGRLLVSADHSVFTNGMLWHGDNALFAIQVAEWLAEGDRDRLLFISDGKALSGFLDSPAFQPPSIDMPTPKTDLATMLKYMTALANNVVKTSQEKNLTNELLARQPRGISASKYRQILLMALATIIILFAVWRFTATSYNYYQSLPKREMKSALDLNHEELGRQEELSRAASMLARDLCRELTGSTDSRVWVQQLSKQSLNPRITSLDRAERARLGTIVDIATNNRTVHVSKKKLEELGGLIQDFRQQHHSQALPSGEPA
ncbi:MAG: hypothetical protein ABJZ55_06685 [Fuerstiella sp.]